MNIAQVIPAYPPASGYGGGPNVCKNISKQLVDRGHSVSVLTTTADDRGSTLEEGWSTKNGVQVYRGPLWSNTLSFRLKMFLPKNFKKYIEPTISDADVVHVHDYRTPLTISVISLADKHDVPVVLQPHGTVPRKDRLVFLKRAFDTVWGETIFGGVDHWFALNSREEDAIQQYDHDNATVSVVPNGITLSAIPDAKPGGFRKKYGISDSKFFILYLGRLHRSKRVDLLLQSISGLDSPSAQVVIAGPDDGDKNRLQELSVTLEIEEQVTFAGRISEADKWRAFKDASVFVTPAFYGFPLTFLEAMSQSTPVVTTSAGDTLNESGQNGIYIVDGTSDALANQLNALAQDVRLEQAGDTAYKRVQDRYTWDSVVDQVEDIYQMV